MSFEKFTGFQEKTSLEWNRKIVVVTEKMEGFHQPFV